MHQTNTSDTPVYDVSNVCFISGSSDFNPYNAYSALRAGRIFSRQNLFAQVPAIIYDKLNSDDQLSFRYEDGGVKAYWREFLVTIDEENDCTSAIVVSELSDESGKKVLLRTREF